MNDIQVLKKAREIISQPENWTKRSFAKDIDGAGVDVGSIFATCFCSIGAVQKAMKDQGMDIHNKDSSVYYSALDKLRDYICEINPVGASIAGYNDNEEITHEDVLKMFDAVI